MVVPEQILSEPHQILIVSIGHVELAGGELGIVSQVDTFVASISIMCIPLLSLFFGYVLWHEPMTLNILVGAAFICSGIVASSLNIKMKKKTIIPLPCK